MKKNLWLALLLMSTVPIVAQSPLPPPFPRTNATSLFENDGMRIWDIVWPKGQPTALHRHPYDQVGTYYARGGRTITTPEGQARTTMTEVGSLSTTRKGTTHIEEGNTDPPLRAVFIELKKDTPSGEPAAPIQGAALFPREGASKVLDDDRVTAWDFTWTAGPVPLRYQAARESVVVWLGTGKLRVSPRQGSPTLVDLKAGSMRHLAKGSGEALEVIEGSPRALVFELK